MTIEKPSEEQQKAASKEIDVLLVQARALVAQAVEIAKANRVDFSLGIGKGGRFCEVVDTLDGLVPWSHVSDDPEWVAERGYKPEAEMEWWRPSRDC